MSASELQFVGSCSSDESSANAKATLFLATSQHYNSQSFSSNRSQCLLEVNLASTGVYADLAGARILNKNFSGSDHMCLSPLA